MLLGSTQYGPMLAPSEALPKAKAAAEKHIRVEYEWDWVGAERAFRQAIALNPSYSTAHRWYSLLLSKLGRDEEAREEINRAKALDPLSPIVNVAVGWQHYLAREYDQAIEQFQQTLEMEPNFLLAHFVLGMTYGQAGSNEEAMAEFQRVIELSRGSPPAVAGVGYAHALLGHESEARKVLTQMNQLSGQHYVSGIYFAAVYAALGEKDEAFRWLDKAYEERADYLSYLKVEPVFDPLRDDPRFAELLRRVGLS
jgi:tetratricopeptide (TPR) repeat protein